MQVVFGGVDAPGRTDVLDHQARPVAEDLSVAVLAIPAVAAGPDGAVAFEGAATLMVYTESSIAKPLSLTGAYAGDSAHHRYMETCRHMFDCTEPGGLRAGGSVARPRSAFGSCTMGEEPSRFTAREQFRR
jgi:hypothetical protein